MDGHKSVLVNSSNIAVIKLSGGISKDLKRPTEPRRQRSQNGSFNQHFTAPSYNRNQKANGIITGNYMTRFNPFNRARDDDDLSVSMASEVTSIASDDSGDISLAELGLTEDYFAQPEGGFGMSTLEELELTIENCKSMVLELPEKSSKRKKICKKLVELRIKLQELKEGPEEIEPKVKQIVGHKLKKRSSNSIKYYCDACNNLIWGVLQVWYRCRDCGFNCHSKCVNSIQRKCVAVDISNISYILNICPELGLSAQRHRCAECKNIISIEGSKDEARLCDYSGQYFCASCHWNDLATIPARVLHNWDFTPQKVSRRSFQLLSRMCNRSILNVQEINPMLFNYVEELADVRKLREDILMMKVYLTTCTNALDQKLLLLLRERQHFVDDACSYSMVDLSQIYEGVLTHQITDIHATLAKHIKFDCLCCQAKGFVCEICNSGETLFPFDTGVATCSKCSAVFHRDCFTCIDTLCPRCERKIKKKQMMQEHELSSSLSNSTSDNENDYLNPFESDLPNDVKKKLEQIKISTKEMESTHHSKHVTRPRSKPLRDFMRENPSDQQVLGFASPQHANQLQLSNKHNR